MWEVLFLLLPLAAYSGWLLGRRAINFHASQELMEAHLALGSLFRREGHLDKAVGIHQQLIDQGSLTAEQRALSLLELSRDYMRAGMLDRAESLLLDLSKQTKHLNAIFQVLLDVYQQTKDWSRALQTAKLWQSKTNRDLSSQIAHYYCEIAEQQWLTGEQSAAIKELQEALRTNPFCVRASLLLGHIEAQQGHYAEAMEAYEQIHRQDQDFLSEIVLPLAKCYGSLCNPEGMLPYFESHLQSSVTTSAVLSLCQWLCDAHNEEVGMSFLRQHLKKRPSLRGLYRLMQWTTQQDLSNPLSKELLWFQELLQSMLNNQSLYRCQACGFSGKTLQWQCPSCKRWDKVKPVDE